MVDETLARETVPQTQEFIETTVSIKNKKSQTNTRTKNNTRTKTNTSPSTTATTTPEAPGPGAPTECIPTNLLVGRVSYSPADRLVGYVQSCRHDPQDQDQKQPQDQDQKYPQDQNNKKSLMMF